MKLLELASWDRFLLLKPRTFDVLLCIVMVNFSNFLEPSLTSPSVPIVLYQGIYQAWYYIVYHFGKCYFQTNIFYIFCVIYVKKIYIFCVPCYSWLKVAPCEIRCIIWRATWRRWVTRPVRGRPMWVPIEEFRLLGPKETLMCLW